MSKFGDNLARRREERGMTQRELAEVSGVPKGSIGNYEAGHYLPRIGNILKLAKVLGKEIVVKEDVDD